VVFLIVISQYDRIKEDEMGDACSKHGMIINEYKIQIRKSEGKSPAGVNVRILYKLTLNGMGMHCIHVDHD
jgi:hypothetical protein